MIKKSEIVYFALRKLVGDDKSTLTSFDPDSIQNAVEDLEGMMAQWRADGIDLFYNFSEDHGLKPSPDHDSFLQLWMKQPVGYNLAALIADDFGLVASDSILTHASQGWRVIIDRLRRPGVQVPAFPLPRGAGDINTPEFSDPTKGYKR